MKIKIISLLIMVSFIFMLAPVNQANSERTEENKIVLEEFQTEFQEEIKSHSREENEKEKEVLLEKENKSEKELIQIKILNERIGNQKLMKKVYMTIGSVLLLCVSLGFSVRKI